MNTGFIPHPIYPQKYDSNYTLFEVVNSTESITVLPSEQFDTTIYIKPVPADRPEVWPTNGFATISGEVLYYDEVGYDQYTNKINALKKCLRNIGNKKSQFNPAGTDIRGFVMAEHHNQLARAIVNVENLIGNATTEDQDTLTWKINDLISIPAILDDYGSPEVNFVCDIGESNPASGTIFNYNTTINGTITNFALDFGDGNVEVNNLSGSYTYPPNFEINPVLTIFTPNSTLVLTCSENQNVNSLTIAVPLAQNVPLIEFPTIPNFPEIIFPDFTPVPVTINFPPVVFPSINIGPLGPINVPSVITFDPPSGIPSVITFADPPIIPSFINVSGVSIPSVVTITPITFGSLGFSPLLIDFVDSTSKCAESPVVVTDGSVPAVIKNDAEACSSTSTVTRLSVKLESAQIWYDGAPAGPGFSLGEVLIVVESPPPSSSPSTPVSPSAHGKTCLIWSNANASNIYTPFYANAFAFDRPMYFNNPQNSGFVDLIFADDSITYL